MSEKKRIENCDDFYTKFISNREIHDFLRNSEFPENDNERMDQEDSLLPEIEDADMNWLATFQNSVQDQIQNFERPVHIIFYDDIPR